MKTNQWLHTHKDSIIQWTLILGAATAIYLGIIFG